MGSTFSSFRVEETVSTHYNHVTVLEKKVDGSASLRLYHVTSNRFEAVLFNPKHSPNCFCLFRITEEVEARKKFKVLHKKLSPFYQSSSKCYNSTVLQELISCLEQHPDWSLAHVASHVGLPECLKHKAIGDSIDSSCSDKKRTPLHLASRSGKLEFVQSLMDFDPKLLVKDKLGNTPLHYAAQKYPEVVNSLLKKGHELGNQLSEVVNATNSKHESALDVACHYSQNDSVQMLLEAGADPRKSHEGVHAIHTAMKVRSEACAATLLEFHPEQIHARDTKYGGTPLHWAKTKEGVELLVNRGADIEAQNNDGETPLHIMARRRRLGCVVMLLSVGANVNAQSSDGSTPLHYAGVVDELDIVRALIVFGADVNLTNKRHETARHKVTVVRQPRWRDVVRALGFVGAAPCDKSQNGCTLECSKPFQEQMVIGETGVRADPKLPGYQDVISITAGLVSAGLFQSSPGLDTVDSGQAAQGSHNESIFKSLHGKESVLTLDGGGIRGLILIQLLLALEEFTKQPIVKLFDWIGGTSTGGILALAVAHGKSARCCQGLYFRMKDLVFRGQRPYDSEPLEKFLRQEFGEDVKMTSVLYPRVLVTGVLADRRPASLHFFRNFDVPDDHCGDSRGKLNFKPPPKPSEQLVWRAARGTGAAPSFFRAMGQFLDGGLIANNPTLDVMTDIHKYNTSVRGEQAVPMGLIVSLGTGIPPPAHVPSFDVFKPESVLDATNVLMGARALGELLIDQATATHGPVVERARAWCQMVGLPYYRFSSPMSYDVGLDETDDRVLVQMLWETRVYVLQHFNEFRELANKLTS
ncbi:85/88 kDa calcium-independent phospholipase A2-like [Acropora palmata]|uniref:85/88 kDa calcium-independent phospholipase A2-like n=1 Tax=Acropora palmata TaxID=6131 RepID=UPI003DA1C4B1